MPNAAQYRDAAHRYRLLGEQYLRQAALASGWRVDTHLAGPVAEAVGGALRSAAAHLTTASGEMARLALVCDGRAVICDEYARRVGEYLALEPLVRRVLPMPSPPYPWASPS
jgi:hypothetical protein